MQEETEREKEEHLFIRIRTSDGGARAGTFCEGTTGSST